MGAVHRTNDVWCVVIKGAYLYKDDAGEKRVGPGEFIFIPGRPKHWSGGDKTEGALFLSGRLGRVRSDRGEVSSPSARRGAQGKRGKAREHWEA